MLGSDAILLPSLRALGVLPASTLLGASGKSLPVLDFRTRMGLACKLSWRVCERI